MRRQKQRILAALLSLVLLLALAPAGWAEESNTGEGTTGDPTVEEVTVTGESVSLPAMGVVLTPGAYGVNINLVPSDKPEAFATEIKNAKVEADLYLIAPAVASTQYDTYSYNFSGSAFSSLESKINAALITEPAQKTTREMMLKSFSLIAQEAAELVKNNNLTTANTPAATTETSISVSGLDAGMYLLILRGNDLTKKDDSDESYFTTTVKTGGGQYQEYDPTAEEGKGEDKEITVTRAVSDNYEFLFEPQIITVPTKMEGNEQSYNTAYGTWVNTLNITAKPDWKERNGILKITKTLTNYADLSKDGTYFEPATFSFSIVGTKTKADGTTTTVYQREVSISVTDPVSEKEVVTLTDIPIGTSVTITESYTGAHYTGSTDPQTVVITAPKSTTDANGNTVVSGNAVKFENTNNNTHRGGHGIENKFEFSKIIEEDGSVDGEWSWIVDGQEYEMSADNSDWVVTK